MSLMLWSRLRVSVMHQLAFILEEQWAVVQFYFIMWVVYAVHASLEHLGVDYSFKFEWLKHNNNLIGW
ncbi:hypothetical protein Poli38472_010695 [Pythium oligandrum]|uniref:Uncharacterized protein n=1 Tax=Pythium oligandrum TaxID=41045 RepID=A0A8K1CGB1_PYTOL|nr:hypothetical protein Poli38472_010695 [Pythium oligandrum]|eukprot:TMW61632.1 hypothetical protein Poli38472_010695 [Pythium oligandrum]